VNETNTFSVQSNDAHTITSQTSAISQLTKQVTQINLENKQMILDWFDQLAAQMEAFMSQSHTTTQCHARGHNSII